MARLARKGVDTATDLLHYAQKHGFLLKASGIYGGLKGCLDFGPYGSELKRNLVKAWYE